MFITISFYSKNKSSLKTLSQIFNKISKYTNIVICSTQHCKNKRLNKLTVLKSPHVNKKAQEQFECVEYKRQISLYTFQILPLFYVIKTIKYNILPDINFKINFFFNRTNLKINILKVLNSNNLFSKSFKNGNKIKQSNKYLELFDMFGEIILKKTKNN